MFSLLTGGGCSDPVGSDRLPKAWDPRAICHMFGNFGLERFHREKTCHPHPITQNFRYLKWRVSKSPDIPAIFGVGKLPLQKPYPYTAYIREDSSILDT